MAWRHTAQSLISEAVCPGLSVSDSEGHNWTTLNNRRESEVNFFWSWTPGLHNPEWPWVYVAKNDPELLVPVFTSNCWVYWCAPPHLAGDEHFLPFSNVTGRQNQPMAGLTATGSEFINLGPGLTADLSSKPPSDAQSGARPGTTFPELDSELVLLVSELCNRVSACHHLSHWTRSQASARWVSHTVPAEACDRFRTQDGLTQLLLPTPLCLPCQSLKLLGMSSFPLQLFLIEVKGVGIGIQVTLWGAFPLRVPGGVGLKPFWKSQVGSVCEWGLTGVGRPGWASSSPQCRCTTLTTTRTVFLVLDSGVLCNRNCRSKVEN